MTCRRRSDHEGRSMPHLWGTKVRINGVETVRCSWCWLRKP